jgi:hypothetical protein
MVMEPILRKSLEHLNCRMGDKTLIYHNLQRNWRFGVSAVRVDYKLRSRTIVADRNVVGMGLARCSSSGKINVLIMVLDGQMLCSLRNSISQDSIDVVTQAMISHTQLLSYVCSSKTSCQETLNFRFP